jgi:large-conductance mechanosensitive channel
MDLTTIIVLFLTLSMVAFLVWMEVNSRRARRAKDAPQPQDAPEQASEQKQPR